jgi:hypothetical protein
MGSWKKEVGRGKKTEDWWFVVYFSVMSLAGDVGGMLGILRFVG